MKRRFVVFLVAVLVVVLARPTTRHARAAGLLLSFSETASHPPVLEERALMDGIPIRTYRPVGRNGTPSDAPGIVLVHGVHHLGIEEPRLVRFARSLADAGMVVLTPEIAELSDYQVAPGSIETAGRAVGLLRKRLGASKVGLMGMSFGGGVALLTAADPRFRDVISVVVAVGAHSDLKTVSTFFAEDPKAHEYGPTVLVYGHADAFFPAEDVPIAREALRLWLHEARDDARRAARELSPTSREKVERLFAADVKSLRADLTAAIGRLGPSMAAVSPHGRLEGVRADVYLLHGEADNVIPASQTLALAEDVPAERRRGVLVTPALQHVELKGPTTRDQWELVHFMGNVLGAVEDGR